jgi:hypothetical protein
MTQPYPLFLHTHLHTHCRHLARESVCRNAASFETDLSVLIRNLPYFRVATTRKLPLIILHRSFIRYQSAGMSCFFFPGSHCSVSEVTSFLRN